MSTVTANYTENRLLTEITPVTRKNEITVDWIIECKHSANTENIASHQPEPDSNARNQSNSRLL